MNKTIMIRNDDMFVNIVAFGTDRATEFMFSWEKETVESNSELQRIIKDVLLDVAFEIRDDLLEDVDDMEQIYDRTGELVDRMVERALPTEDDFVATHEVFVELGLDNLSMDDLCSYYGDRSSLTLSAWVSHVVYSYVHGIIETCVDDWLNAVMSEYLREATIDMLIGKGLDRETAEVMYALDNVEL